MTTDTGLFSLQKETIPLKLFVFLFYGGIFSLLPYLSVHMKSIGLSIQETAIIYALIVLASFVGAPLAGFLVDKLGRYSLVLTAIVVTTAILHNCLLLVPETGIDYLPPEAHFVCTKSGGFVLVQTCPEDPDDDQIHCVLDYASDTRPFYEWSRCRYECDPQWKPNYWLTTDSVPPVTTGSPPHSRHHHRSIDVQPSKEHENHHPPPEQEPSTEVKICFANPKDKARRVCHDVDVSDLNQANFTFSRIAEIYESRRQCAYRVMGVLWEGTVNYSSMKCFEDEELVCRLLCPLRTGYNNGTLVKCPHTRGSHGRTLYSYFVLRFLCMVLLGATFPLIESAILIKMKEHGAQYGKQRVWANVAGALFPPIVGLLIDKAKVANVPMYYFPAFIIFDVFLLLLLIIALLKLNVDIKPPISLSLANLRQMGNCWEVILLYTVAILLGFFWGFLETFLFWFLLDLGADNFLLGISRTVGSLICIPPMFFADYIMNKIGRVNIIIITFICYAIQLYTYAVISNPWFVVILEVFKFFTSCLKLAAMVTLANSLAPKGLLATMQGTVRCLQYEIGSGLGNLVGGTTFSLLGPRSTFRILGTASGIVGAVYGVLYYILTKRKGHTIPCPIQNNVGITEEMEKTNSPETGV